MLRVPTLLRQHIFLLTDNEEPEYRKIADLLYEYLATTYDAYARYTERVGTIVGLVESVRRVNSNARAECAAFEASAPLPLACLLLRPPHRALHLHTIAHELYAATGSQSAKQALELASRAAGAAHDQLRHVENHAALCQLQRDIVGYDKLLVPNREFIRLGCVYKHSTRGLQQRMLFLFSDLLVVASRAGGAQFRAHAALPLHTLVLKHADLPHSFLLEGEDVQLLISTSNDHEYVGWTRALDETIANAHEYPSEIDTELTPYEQDVEPVPCGGVAGGGGGGGGGLSHVCWHRATSLTRDQMHLACRTQLSGYLLRKFKKSPGWQKLWVVFAVFTLFFYKNWQDDAPLASLPLLGYGVMAPDAGDGIDKEFVFKLQFKNHVYFFRADSIFTYNRWVEVLQTSMVRYDHN
ncbi:hypothetical protein ABMA28_011741 [Loxostege sticticalis]|uniref:Uncharacterized protein n=1 Tax=Loxostege sticticalis TaxID=481309 RepID=A0ABD0TKB9_LOXSC